MPIKYDIDAADLLKFVGRARSEMPKNIQAATAQALNEVGDAMVTDIVRSITQQTGLPQTEVEDMLTTKNATPLDLTYIIDTTLLAEAESDTERRLPGRSFGGGGADDPFAQEQLVRVVTMEDDTVCPICEAIAEAGPYTLREAQTNVHHGATIGKNNCRCILVPFQRTRRLTSTMMLPRVNNLGRRVNTRELVRQSVETMAKRVRDFGSLARLRVKNPLKEL